MEPPGVGYPACGRVTRTVGSSEPVSFRAIAISSPPSLKALLNRDGLTVEKSYKTQFPLWYPDSFLRYAGLGGKIAELSRRLIIATLLPFAPLVGLGALIGKSDSITLFARK